MLESRVAADGRLISHNREIRGRPALADEIAQMLADPQFDRIVSAIDVGETTFRFQSAEERRDGTALTFFDAGQVDATGAFRWC